MTQDVDLYEPLVLACEQIAPTIKAALADGTSPAKVADGLVAALAMLYSENGDQDIIVDRVVHQIVAVLQDEDLHELPLFKALQERLGPLPENAVVLGG